MGGILIRVDRARFTAEALRDSKSFRSGGGQGVQPSLGLLLRIEIQGIALTA